LLVASGERGISDRWQEVGVVEDLRDDCGGCLRCTLWTPTVTLSYQIGNHRKDCTFRCCGSRGIASVWAIETIFRGGIARLLSSV
jgi:hypothetical protein